MKIEPLPFSEDEIFRAYRLVMDEEQAREMAADWASIPEKILSGESIGWGLAEGSYVVLSLLGGETTERVERDYVDRLGPEERARFRRLQHELRAHLEDEGKL